MNCKPLFALAVCFCLVGCADNAPSEPNSKKAVGAGTPGEMKLPPGWTEADMQACMMAGQPGKQHERLAKDVGTWHGKNTMWMGPGGEAQTTESTTVVTSIMNGHYTKGDVKGEMPGMGPFEGCGVYGFDNVSQKFVSTWIDSQNTGIMYGTGDMSADGKTITWKYTYNCPILKKPVVMREIDRWNGPNSKTLEMWGPDPKSGKEYKMMQMELTRK
jgi:hypothetical protein